MEAASAAPSLPARVRTGRFERECEQLRPLGEAYVLRRFGGSLNRADAEDAVAEVLVRLHRMFAAGRAPQNLRATFFASVRNQAIDQLRSRAARPTVELEAAGEAPALGPAVTERAEGREDAARLQEALGRMRGNYREAILLRFGLGMTVPEIAAHCEISLPAAKKLVLRATAQARKRLEAIEGADFCPEVRELTRRSLLEKHLSGLCSEEEAALLRAHLSHCGPCKSFLASLHERMLDLGSAAVFGFGALERFGGHLGIADHLGALADSALGAAQAGVGRLRHLSYKATGAFSGSDGPTGALLSSAQKVAAICTAGAASAATCLLTGAVGPGISATAAPADPHPRAPAASARLLEPASAPIAVPPPVTPEPEPAPESSHSSAPEPTGGEAAEPAAAPAPAAPVKSAAVSEPREFGIDGAGTPSAESAPAPSTPSPARPSGATAGGAFGSEGESAAGAGSPGPGVGFHG